MSIIQFWSPYHGLGQTSNLHVSAFNIGLLNNKKVLIMQTHFDKNNLESPLVGYNVEKSINRDQDLFQGIGLDMAVTYSKMRRLSSNALESCCLTIPKTSFLLLPGTETRNKETFDRDIGKSVNRMIRDADEHVDYVLIDTNSGDDELSLSLMNMADLIVINLTQRRYVLDKFFLKYGERFIDDKRVFYLFGDYDDKSSYNINNCRRKYSKYINGSNSGVIPYCTKYMDAQNESDVLAFMKEGFKPKNYSDFQRIWAHISNYLKYGKYAQEETDYFFHRARLSVNKMLGLLHKPTRKGRAI